MNYVFSDNVHILCLSCNVKNSTAKFAKKKKKAETSVVLIVFDDVLCDIHSCTVAVFLT